jgi:hypothetical protein
MEAGFPAFCHVYCILQHVHRMYRTSQHLDLAVYKNTATFPSLQRSRAQKDNPDKGGANKKHL